MTKIQVKRRLFLQSLVSYSLCAGSLPVATASGREGNLQALARSFVGSFARPESARAIGLEYLKTKPVERDLTVLVSKLSQSIGNNVFEEYTEADSSWKSELSKQLAKDFREGRVVRVDGWVLSQTEVRMYALAALV